MYIFTQNEAALIKLSRDIKIEKDAAGWYDVKHGEDKLAQYDNETDARVLVAFIAKALEEDAALFKVRSVDNV